jgi:hypothetical protein
MDDTLLKRADRAIREGHLIRDQARDGVMRAKIMVARIKGTRGMRARRGREVSPPSVANGWEPAL